MFDLKPGTFVIIRADKRTSEFYRSLPSLIGRISKELGNGWYEVAWDNGKGGFSEECYFHDIQKATPLDIIRMRVHLSLNKKRS